jgi:hypothetical protein
MKNDFINIEWLLTFMYIPHVELPHASSTSTADPIQYKPPFEGAGSEQFRYRY